jgi:sarcosine oxidase subunit alpha
MPERISVTINGRRVEVAEGTTIAAAMIAEGVACRRSVSGKLRGPLCGMGICFECRAMVDGVRHCRTCQLLCKPEMDIRTQ